MWVNFTDLHYFLNNSNTDNNTWALGLLDRSSTPGNPGWCFVPDTDGTDMSYMWETTGTVWTKPEDADFISRLTFNLAGSLGEPTMLEFGAVINKTMVQNGVVKGTGNWTSYEEYGSDSGSLKFVVNFTEWENSACNITLFQINYTKDLALVPTFKVSGSGQDIIWNVSINENINYFMDALVDRYINFTIPSTWSNIQVWNGASNRTNDVTLVPLGNGFQLVQLRNAVNGTNWFLNATSTNLIQSIDTYVGGTATSIVNTTDIVHFNLTFSQIIAQDDGTINLEVYSPAAISNKLNFTSSLSTFSSGTEISITDWDISNNVTQLGNFRVQMVWSNNTAAGFLEKITTIRGATEFTINSPPDMSVHTSTEVFNMTAYFNDTGLESGISGASIDIDVNGTTYNTNWYDEGGGNYKIKINCSDSIFVLNNWSVIRVNISKQYYYNQSATLTINVTTIVIDTTPPTWDEAPTDQTVEFGSPFSYDVNASDANGIDSYNVNDTTNFQVDGNGIITNATALAVGIYWLEINASDPSNNNATATIKITVQDTTDPTWDQVPTDQTVELGQPFSYDLNATDLQTITYTVNDTSNFAMNAATGELTNNTALTVAMYSLQINATDASGNVIIAYITVTVEDNTDPVWDQVPTGQTVELGQPFIYDLNATDLQTITYTV
ncbi:MAG: cadherin repeat domain-containing protein, partial [Thermoplasmatales archaeon]